MSRSEEMIAAAMLDRVVFRELWDDLRDGYSFRRGRLARCFGSQTDKLDPDLSALLELRHDMEREDQRNYFASRAMQIDTACARFARATVCGSVARAAEELRWGRHWRSGPPGNPWSMCERCKDKHPEDQVLRLEAHHANPIAPAAARATGAQDG